MVSDGGSASLAMSVKVLGVVPESNRLSKYVVRLLMDVPTPSILVKGTTGSSKPSVHKARSSCRRRRCSSRWCW
jgi:hypothetical protein